MEERLHRSGVEPSSVEPSSELSSLFGVLNCELSQTRGVFEFECRSAVRSLVTTLETIDYGWNSSTTHATDRQRIDDTVWAKGAAHGSVGLPDAGVGLECAKVGGDIAAEVVFCGDDGHAGASDLTDATRRRMSVAVQQSTF